MADKDFIVKNGLVVGNGDLSIPDKITHLGDTNTAIRFPAADTVTVETSGAERLRVDSSGRVLQGTGTSITGAGSLASVNQVAGTTAASGRSAFVYSATNTAAPVYEMGKSANATVGSHTLVDDGETLGTLRWSGSDGTNFIRAAEIAGIVNGTPGTNDMPGALTFGTTADGGISPTERMRIDSSGNVGIGTNSPGYELDVQGATDPSIRVRATGTGVSDDSLIRMQIAGTTANNIIQFGDSADADAGYISYDHASDYFAVGVNAAERMRITSTGNVGIGTSSPSTRLSVSGDTTFGGAIVETVFALSGTTPALDPSNGTVQTWTLSANSSPTDSLVSGEAMTLMINDGSAYTITWPSVTWKTDGGSAPTLNTTGFTAVILWKVSTTLYGARVGDA